MAGNAEAQFQLAKDYFSGEGGVPRDSKQGVEWLRKAANLELPSAQLALSVMYLSGGTQYIPKDPKQGLQWLRKAADHGYAPAEHNLAVQYRDGNEEAGVPHNAHLAAAWFRKAARQTGSVKSQAGLEEMLQKGLISKQEANWRAPEPNVSQAQSQNSGAAKGKAIPFSLAEVSTGLAGGITSKRMATLVQKFGVDFKLSDASRKTLADRGADDALLSAIAASRRSL